jgi:antitoxin component YwqK of YwqJK toxin-antitoxin module
MLVFGSFDTVAQTDTVFNQTDAAGLKQGWWKKPYPNGKPMYKGYFKDNRPVGVMKRYFESGKLRAILVYDKQGESSRVTLFYDDGQKAAEGKYFGTQKDSTWTYYSYYSHTPTTKENYNRGVREGHMLHYYNNGNVSEKIYWKADLKDGVWEQYFNNNILKLKGTYKKGKLEGVFTVNYEDGKPYLSGSYVNDLREGKWILYNEEGGVAREITYKNGMSPDEEKLDARQQEMIRMIEENKGRIEEPDEINFMSPGGR